MALWDSHPIPQTTYRPQAANRKVTEGRERPSPNHAAGKPVPHEGRNQSSRSLPGKGKPATLDRDSHYDDRWESEARPSTTDPNLIGSPNQAGGIARTHPIYDRWESVARPSTIDPNLTRQASNQAGNMNCRILNVRRDLELTAGVDNRDLHVRWHRLKLKGR